MRTWLYIAVMALVTYLILALPLTVFHKKIQNRWVRSFLYYVPYACLSAMTFPAIFLFNSQKDLFHILAIHHSSIKKREKHRMSTKS